MGFNSINSAQGQKWNSKYDISMIRVLESSPVALEYNKFSRLDGWLKLVLVVLAMADI